jgi:hypothetical protein
MLHNQKRIIISDNKREMEEDKCTASEYEVAFITLAPGVQPDSGVCILPLPLLLLPPPRPSSKPSSYPSPPSLFEVG